MTRKPTYEELEQRVKELEKEAISRNKGEKALLSSESLLKSIMDNAPALISAKDLEGNVMMTNRRFEVLDGPSPEDFIGKNVYDLFPFEIADALWKNDLAALEADAPVESEEIVAHKDGVLHTYHTVKFPLYENTGKTFGTCAISVDITERKEAEEALRKTQDELEKRVEERTTELVKTNEQLKKEIEERTHVKGALRESEEKYRSLLDDVIDRSEVGLFILDSDFSIVWVNQALESYFGLRREEVIGKDKRQLILEQIKYKFDDPEGFADRVLATYDNNTYVENFECHLLPNGERKERHLEHWSRPIQSGLYAGGRVELYYDITERKQAEGALRDGEEFTTSLLENSPIPIMVINPDTSIRYVNPLFEELIGFTSAEVLGKKAPYPWWIYDPKFGTIDQRKKLIAQGVRRLERRCRKKNGEHLWVETNITPIFRHGKFEYSLSTWVDITERKHSEKELKESEERFKKLSESTFEGIMIHEGGKIIDANSTFAEMFGYELSELIGTDVMKLTSPELQEKARNNLKKESEQPYESVGLRKNGSTFMMEINARMHYDEGRRVRVTACRDITEQKKAEEEKKKLEAQLQQAYKMEALGTLAGGIAHDFNNILSPIMLHSEMSMMELSPDSPVQHNLKEIFRAGERARDMVRQILAFGRQKEPERIVIKMGSILKELIKLLRSSIPSTIDIQYNIEAGVDTIFADPTQIHQVILNLCTNASHAMREKGGVLEIGLDDLHLDSEAARKFTGLNPGSYLRLTIRDTGEGIEPEILDRIFDPYFTTKGPGEGTGMGLAVAHGIVMSHGGDIHCESNPGEGTTFRVLFSKYEGEVLEDSESIVPLPRGTERILFVDDEKGTVDAIQPMLTNLGYKVTARTSSVEALEAFRNNPEGFDLVITDMTMPNMTGKELAKELMTIRSDIPIILCTGFSEQIDENKAKEMGINAFVMKPIVMKEIANTIREVLDYPAPSTFKK